MGLFGPCVSLILPDTEQRAEVDNGHKKAVDGCDHYRTNLEHQEPIPQREGRLLDGAVAVDGVVDGVADVGFVVD